VLAGAALRLLDRVAVDLGRVPGGAPPRRILDVGTGVGLLALAAGTRWPDAEVIAVDASAAMLGLARRRAGEHWPDAPEGIAWREADAAALPLPDASMDLVLSSFMLQLVPDRRAVLQEVGRVLRPGGRLGLVTWLAGETILPPDLEFDEALLDLDLEDPEAADEVDDAREGEYADAEAARTELEACGFVAVDARLDTLEYGWSREGYAAFKEGFDEWDLVDSLTPADLARLRARLAERWATLPDEAFVLRAPLVSVVARRPD
jgi:SAM-dependent methyltransferase